MLGFPTLARAWFGISLILYSISLFHWDCIVATMFMSTLSFISFMSLKAMFIVCSSFISSVARLWKPCICSYSAHPIGPWVSDRLYVSMVLGYLFICGCPYIPRRVVDRIGDSCIESFIVHPPYILMLGKPGLEGRMTLFSTFLSWCSLCGIIWLWSLDIIN
jgi:hypothetical protein